MSTHAHTAASAAKETKVYAGILAALLLLTVLTVTAAGINFGSSSINTVIALTIATIKASLVALFFMHLAHDKPVNGVILVAAFVFLGLFLGFTLVDANSRVRIEPENLKVPVTAPAKTAAKPALPAGD